MTLKTYEFTTDLIIDIEPTQNIRFFQNDHNSAHLVFFITDRKQPVNLTNAQVKIVLQKPDGTIVFQDNCNPIDAATGKYEVILNTQTLVVDGKGYGQIHIENGDKILECRKFELYIDKSILSQDALESTNEFLALQKAIQAGVKLEGIDIDEIVAAGNIVQEVVQARVDEKGVAHTTLKGRIDKGFQDSSDKFGVLFKNKTDWVNVVETYSHLKVAIAQGYDWTPAINKAYDDLALKGNGTLYIPDGEYWINVNGNGGIKTKDNSTLIMSDNAVLKAIPTASSWYRVINVYNKRNVFISGGQLIGDRDAHLDTVGQSGFGIEVNGSENVTILKVKASKFWGDGFCIMESSELGESKNVKVLFCQGTDNRRQGLSATGLKDGLILGCNFSNTGGQDPSAGIDIEPNAGCTCENITISVNICHGNKHGIIVYNQFDNAVLQNIAIDGNLTHNNTQEGIWANGIDGLTIGTNTAVNNGYNGFHIQNSRNVSLGTLIANKNGNHGVHLHNASGITGGIIRAERNAMNGIFFNQSFAANLTTVTTKGNEGNGIRFYKSSHNKVNNSVSLGNKSDNVYFEQYSSYNEIRNCKVKKIYEFGVVQASNSNIITLDYSASKDASEYTGMTIEIFAGSGAGEVKTITSYNKNTRQATLDSPFINAPSPGISQYQLYPATKSPYGITIADATCNYNEIKDNDLTQGGQTEIIKDLGWKTEIQRNKGCITESTGTLTYSGNGSNTTRSIAHGLAKTPSYWHVERASVDAGNAGIKYVIADETNLNVFYNTAPISGTNNVTLKWKAEV